MAKIISQQLVNLNSIFEHILRHVNPEGPGLLPGGEMLPDEDEYSEDLEILWMPGARDILEAPSASVPDEEKEQKVREIIDAFRNLKPGAEEDALKRLEDVLNFHDTLTVIDRLLQRLVVNADIDQSLVYQACRYLLFNTKHRAVIKMCMGIMGLYDVPQDIPIFKLLSRHEEFTLYGAVAVISGSKDTTPAWFEMAKAVTGWGRIHLVNRLTDSNDKEVREWLLKEGCRNDISEEHTALAIAEAVDLAKVLSKKTIDRETFTGAGVILQALAGCVGSEPPFKGLELYKKNAEAVKEYLRHAEKHARTLDDFLVIESLVTMVHPEFSLLTRDYLRWGDSDYDEVLEKGHKLIKRDSWQKTIEIDLRSTNPEIARKAIKVADIMGVDVQDTLLDMLRERYRDEYLWFLLTNRADISLAQYLVKFALEKFNSEEVNRRTVENRLLDVHNPVPTIIDLLLDMLYRFPGTGVEFIEYTLRRGNAANRLRAFKVLNAWERGMTTEGIRQAVEQTLTDSDDMVSISGEHLIKKWS